MQIQLSDHFGYGRLLRFTLPSMAMMVFTSVYGVVDGIFVSNFAGKTAYAAVNFIYPFLMILGVVGFMFGAGGSALIAKTIGEHKRIKANRIFSMLVWVGIVLGIALATLGGFFLPQIAKLLGGSGQMAEVSVLYGRIILLSLPFFILQNMFQSLLVTAEKPRLALWVTVIAGVSNIVLDYVLIALLHMGIVGAAVATCASEVVGGIIPLLYFLRPNDSLLRITLTRIYWGALGKVCFNGLSEFVGSISASLVSMCYNYQLLRFMGENGVAAYGTIMYVQFVFFGIFLGYTLGAAPVVSYNFGARRWDELRGVFRRSLVLVAIMGVVLTAIIELFAGWLTGLFTSYDPALHQLTWRAFMIYGTCYLLVGVNFYISSFFTALNNGFLSALVSVMRSLVCEVSAVFLIPMAFGPDSIWLAAPASELGAFLFAILLLLSNRKRYHY